MAFDDSLNMPAPRAGVGPSPRLSQPGRFEAQDLAARVSETDAKPQASPLEKLAGWTLGIGAVLMGGRRLLQNSELALKAVGEISGLASRILFPARAIGRGVMDGLAGVRSPRPSVVESLPFLDRIGNQLELLRQARAMGASSADLTVLREGALRGLDEWGHGAAPAVGGLRRMTVQDVLQSGYSDARRALSLRARQTMQEGLAEGILTPGMTLTGQRTGGLYVGATGKVVDARIADPAVWGSLANKALGQLRIPFTAIKPVNILTSIFRPFTRGAFAGEVGPRLSIGPGQKTEDGVNFVIGNRLYSNATGAFREVEGIRGIKLGQANSATANARFLRYGHTAFPGDAELGGRIAAGSSGFRGFLDRIQFATGIGKPYRTQDPVWKTLGKNVVTRRTEGDFYAFPYVQRQHNQGTIANALDSWRAKARGVDPQAFLSEAVPHTRPMGVVEKIKTYFDMSRRAAVVRRGVTSASSYTDLAVTPVQHGAFPGGYHSPLPGALLRPTGLGNLATEPLVRNQYYAYRGNFGEAFADVANMLTTRLNDLVGHTTGLGFRPAQGVGTWGGLGAAGKNLTKLYGLFAAGQAAVGYASYADSLLEQTNPWRIGVRKAIMALYAGLRMSHQSLRELFGVSGAARSAEDLMPKSMDSAASFLARTVGPIALGLAKGGRAGMMKGAALSLAIGGSDVGQKPGDLWREFTGEKMVPIRRSRWWVLGRQPWEGGQIDYFAPSWFARQWSDYRFTDTQYGSKGDYFSHVANIDLPIIGHIPLPTPHNLFGAVPLLDGDFFGGGQDYLAEKHRADRPYPDTPGINYEAAVLGARQVAGRGPYDPPIGAGQRLGMGTAGTLGPELGEPRGMAGRISKGLDDITQLGGVYRFLFNSAKDEMGFHASAQLATASSIGSAPREFYDEQVGGMLGMTELYRRFVPVPEKGINPIPNTMPDWLPGSFAREPGDRSFSTDFSLGDPYAKIKHGEFRLPGEAYERMHKLHSGTSGIYDPMDRFMILADIAPNSDSYKHYKTIVDSWQKAGVLDSYWGEKYGEVQNQVKEKMKRYDFVDRRFTGLITDPDPEGTDRKYNFLEKALGGGWERLTHDLIPRIGETVPIFGPLLADKLLVARSPVEQYEQSLLYGEEFADWKSPWRAFLRPKLNRLAARDPITALMGGLSFAAMGANPISALALGAAGGATATGMSLATPDNWIPQHRENEWGLQEYMDNLRYSKSRILETRAAEMGDTQIQQYYRKEQGRTVTGMNYGGNPDYFIARQIRALPTEFKGFVAPFMQMSPEAQQHIYPMLPDYLKPSFAAGWARNGSTMFEGLGDEVAQLNPDQRAARFFGSNGGLPDSDWAGWHPDVPLDAVKIKMVDTGSNSTAADIHRFGLFDEHRFRAERFPELDVPAASVNQARESRISFDNLLNNAGFTSHMITPSYAHSSDQDSDSIDWRIMYDRRARMRQMVSQILR